MTRRCYLCAAPLTDEGAGWIVATPPKCQHCADLIARLR